MTKKLAVFDWNGTLMDDSEANWKASHECLKHFGASPITHEQYRDTMDFPVLHFYTRNGVDTDTYLAQFQEAGESFMGSYLQHAENYNLRGGTIPLLNWLLDHDWHLMVLSNFLEEKLKAQLAKHHVLHYFHHVSGNVAFNEREHSKTNKLERLQHYLDQNDFDLSQSFIIGDSLEEPDLARKLGLTAISVTWGCFSRARLENFGPDHIIDDLAEVQEILQKRAAA